MMDRGNDVTKGLEMTLVASPPDLEVRVLMTRSLESKVTTEAEKITSI